MAITTHATNSLKNNSASYYTQLSLSEGLKQYIQKVKNAVSHSLWIRDTYSTSSYKQPLIPQPMTQPKNGPSDAPFNMTDLEIYPDDYSDPLPIYGIKTSEYKEIKEFYENVINGKSKIILSPSLSPELRRLIEMDLILLLTRPTSRALLLSFSKYEQSITLDQGEKNCFGNNVIFLNEVVIESLISREINDKQNQFLAPLPHFSVLAHELIHALHNRLYGWIPNGRPTLSRDFDDLIEQFAITGHHNAIAYMVINEQRIHREFGIPYREDHRRAGSFPPDTSPCDIFPSGKLPIQYAAKNGATLNVIHFLKTGGDANIKLKHGRTLLHEAATGSGTTGRNFKIATSLIDFGAKIDSIDDQNRTPLRCCSGSEAIDIGTLLMERVASFSNSSGSAHTSIQTPESSLLSTNPHKNAPPRTEIKIKCKVPIGHALTLRGQGGGLSWGHRNIPQRIDNETFLFTIEGMTEGKFEYKLLLDDSDWESGANHIVEVGKSVEITPALTMPKAPLILVNYNGPGNLFLRGTGPGMESWNKPIQLKRLNGVYVFEWDKDESNFEFKILRNDKEWSLGDNYKFTKGKTLQIEPIF